MKKATFISVVLVCCTIFLSNLSAQQIPNSSFDNWSGGTPTPYKEWGYSAACVVPTEGYNDTAAKLQEVEEPGKQPYEFGMGIEAFPCTTIYSWLRINYKCNQQSGDNIGLSIEFFDEFENQLSSGYGLIDNGWNTNEWKVKDVHTNFYGTSILPSKGRIKFDGNASDPYNSSLIVDELMLIEAAEITEPEEGDTWIAGEIDTIKWDYGTPGFTIKLQYSPDDGVNWTHITDVKADSGKYAWHIPDTLLSANSAIRIVHGPDEDLKTHDYVHLKIKPYIITKLRGANQYVVYDKDIDRWGFGNYLNDMFPYSWWYHKFDYKNGKDPFTDSTFSQWQGFGAFANAFRSDFPDWISFVKAFSINTCYISTTFGVYSPTALLRWKAIKRGWGGSCFGIANANALAFQDKAEFLHEYPDFPNYLTPKSVKSDTNVIKVITELQTKQFGRLTYLHHNLYNNTSVNNTLNELKLMLKEDNTSIRTLFFKNSGGSGAHAVLPYKLEQDKVDKRFYYVWVWDNSYPNDPAAKIRIDTLVIFGSEGAWRPMHAWEFWGGTKGFFLEPVSDIYLDDVFLPKTSLTENQLLLPRSVEIDVTEKADILITDSLGNNIGFQNNNLINEISNARPLMYVNGSEGPPYGYTLGITDYSIELNNFTSDTISTYFFSQNKAFSYERYDANENQTDGLLYDGGITIVNQDEAAKSVSLMNIVAGDDDERVFIFRGLNVNKDESIKLINPDDYNLDLISSGDSKLYDIELNHALKTGLMRFNHKNIELNSNSSHKLRPNWGDFAALRLEVLVDDGNDGTIDDTLHLDDQSTGVEKHGSNTPPIKFILEQNYPNPFNNSTVIQYSIPQEGLVTLKIYNSIGEEVATLINELKQTGNYAATFDATNLTSGIYFYRLQVYHTESGTGEYLKTNKMVLLK